MVEASGEAALAERTSVDWFTNTDVGRLARIEDRRQSQEVADLNEDAVTEIGVKIADIARVNGTPGVEKYREQINDLIMQTHLEMCQAKLVVDLREETIKSETEKYKEAGLTEHQARQEAIRISVRGEQARLSIIKYGGAFTREDYDRLSRGEDIYLPETAESVPVPEIGAQAKPFWSGSVSAILESEVPESQEAENARIDELLGEWPAPMEVHGSTVLPAKPKSRRQLAKEAKAKPAVPPLPETFWDASTPVAVMPSAPRSVNILPPMSRIRELKFNAKLWLFNHQRLVRIGGMAIAGTLLTGGVVELIQSIKQNHSHIANALNSHTHGSAGNNLTDTHRHHTQINNDNSGHHKHDHNTPELADQGRVQTVGNRGVWGDVENIGIKHGVYLSQDQVHHYVAQIMAHNSSVSWANARDIPAGTHYVIPQHVMEMLTKKAA